MQRVALGISWLVIGAIAYQQGFRQGDLDRRLKDVDIMTQQTESEMVRHYQAENYWQDKAEECTDQLKRK